MTQDIYRWQTEFGVWEQTAWEPQQLRPPGRGNARVDVECCRLTWRSSPELIGQVPPDLCIEFGVYRGADGVRRFVPIGGYRPFIHNSWLVGLAILRRRRNLSNHEVLSYRAMKFAFDRGRAGREHLDRRFSAARDLYVRRTGRGGDITASLLPDYVGSTADGGGNSWSIRELTERGRAEAIAAGIINPTNDQAIPYALTQAAEMNPLIGLNSTDARALIFMALFDAGEETVAVDDTTIDDVAERLTVALQEHANDHGDRFTAWISGRNNNLVKTLAQKAGFPRLPRESVKAALLQLAQRSYEYIANCLSCFAQALRSDVREPLSAAERLTFDAIYLPQVCFGGLPLVLLLERGDLLGPVITRLWESPNDERLIGALHRLLHIYAQLAPARRAADRRFKELQRALRPQQVDRTAASTDQATNDDSLPERRLLQAATRRLLRTRREGCPECTDLLDWEIECEPNDDSSVIVHLTCEKHDFVNEYQVTLDDMIAAVNRERAQLG